MEQLMKQSDHNQTEETCEESTPKIETEENFDISDYDYHKRLWF